MEQRVVELGQDDFAHGSYLLNHSHVRLVLRESVQFNPNPQDDWMPRPDQLASNGGPYDDDAFQLGFFAAIVVGGGVCNWTIDLNGHELSQHPDHALQQRFFAVIEVGPAPFVENAGPAAFVPAGQAFVGTQGPGHIVNGTLGLSSHHGIHGNDGAGELVIQRVTFRDFEVAAIHLNNHDRVTIRDVVVDGNRRNVPVLGTYSAARFIRPHLQLVADDDTLGRADRQRARDTLRALQQRMDATLEQVRATGATTDPLFQNASGLVDGNVYGIVVHGRGPAVNDLSAEHKHALGSDAFAGRSTDLVLENVVVRNLVVAVREVVALSEHIPASERAMGRTRPRASRAYSSGMQTDPVGAVFQTQLPQVATEGPGDGGQFLGAFAGNNELAEAQALVARYHGKGTLSDGVVSWVLDGTGVPLHRVMRDEYLQFHCNGDSMFHVDKGIFGVRLDSVSRAVLRNVEIHNVQNLSGPGSAAHAGAYTRSHPMQTQTGYQGTTARGLSLAACSDVTGTDIRLANVQSVHGHCYMVTAVNGTRDVSVRFSCPPMQQQSEVQPHEARSAVDASAGPNPNPPETRLIQRDASSTQNVALFHTPAENAEDEVASNAVAGLAVLALAAI